MMNEQKFNAIFNGLNSVAKKIYESVPSAAYWSVSRIASDLFSRGIKFDGKTMSGTLGMLVKNGLLIEAEQGMFSREKVVKASSAQKKLIEPKQKEEAVNAKDNKDNGINSPMDMLREMALKLMDISTAVQTLAVQMDRKVGEIEKQIADSTKDNEKLKQLQALLKSLG